MQHSKVDMVIHGGLIASSTSADVATVAIKGEKIVLVGPQSLMPAADRYIDASGKIVFPGLIDSHVHLGAVDDWTNGSQGAALSGLTTLMPFATYAGSKQGKFADVVRNVVQEASSQSVLDFAPHFILTNDPTTLEGLPDAIKLGIMSFKMFMTYKKRLNRMCSDEQILQAMEIIAANGGILQVHAENGDLINYLEDQAISEGRVKPVDYPATAPPMAEIEAVGRVITLAGVTDCPLYIVHMTTQGGLQYVKQALSKGQRVWAETCPQYLLLSENEMERLGPFAKIGPPLRSADMVNQNALWEGAAQGYVSTIGSDHSVHPKVEKEQGWENVYIGPEGRSIPFGAPSLETLVPLMYSEGVVKRGLPVWWMARLMAENPARIFGIYPRKGVIRSGSDADLLIWDPNVERTIREADLLSRAGFTPYEGWQVKGMPWMTLLRGKVLLQDGKLHLSPGDGQFLPAGSRLPPIGGPVT
jgi:dihydropyrimidinase